MNSTVFLRSSQIRFCGLQFHCGKSFERMQVAGAIGGFDRGVQCDFCFVGVGLGFVEIMDRRNDVRRFDDEQRLTGLNNIAFVCENFKNASCVRRKHGLSASSLKPTLPVVWRSIHFLFAYWFDAYLF
jgi:hypothetical protein